MGTPNDLFALQKTDTTLFQLRGKLHELQEALQDPKELVVSRATAQNLTQNLATNGANVKDLELQLGSIQEKLNRSTENLYSGRVKNPKELEDLENEVNSLNGRVEDLELELMEFMEQQEKISTTLKDNQATLDQMESDWAEKTQAIRVEQGEVATEMKAILAKRQAQAAKIDAPIMNNYVKLLKSKAGLGIVKLSGSKCEGCKISMDGGTVRQVNTGQWVSCPSCGRYLIK